MPRKSVRSPSKGDSPAKKRVRFQEPVKGEPDENVTYLPRERDTEVDLALFSEDRNWKKDLARPDLFYGKFSKEEDDKLRNAAFRYIKMRGWDEKEGLEIVLHSSRHPDARGCWLEIAKCLPVRPVKQIHSRAQILLGDYKRGNWTAAELEELTELYKAHGNNWIKIGTYMNRSAQICKDRWRRLRLLPNRKSGTWDQGEYNKLSKLVRRSLRVKESIPGKSIDRRQLRDDINWEWISEEMQRDSNRCADAWYLTLASPMITAGKWANGDDRLFLERLIELGATSEEALDWDNILEHRDGDVCTMRWKEMTRLLGKSDHVSFEDKLELLANRYAPDLLGIEEED